VLPTYVDPSFENCTVSVRGYSAVDGRPVICSAAFSATEIPTIVAVDGIDAEPNPRYR
jgi:hypothetical protein